MKKISTILALFLFVPTIIMGQFGQNIKEKRQDKKEIKQSQKIIIRDKQELNQFIIKAKEYRKADSLKSTLKIKNLHRGILADMEREINQTKLKIKEAKTEVTRSKKEVRGENREIKKDLKDLSQKNGDHKDDKKDLARNKRDKRDDIRDTKDDKRDLNQLKKRLTSQIKLKNKFNKNKKNLKALKRFTKTLIADGIQNKNELREDKIELKEDRKETKNDRIENREIR